MSAASNVFNSASAFESYLATLTERLRGEREARIAFLMTACEKLAPLLELAQSLQSESTVAEVSAHLAAARAEIADLQGQAS